jgi:hypothetical protein
MGYGCNGVRLGGFPECPNEAWHTNSG